MQRTTELAYLGIAETGALFRRRELSPVELTQALIERTESVQDRLVPYVTPTPELALEQARAAEAALLRGDDASPLLGIPVGIKDIVMTKGIRTTCGSVLHEHWVPDVDAAVIERWRAAGTVMMGKLSTHEFTSGLQPPGHMLKPARNPWNPAQVPGGSSSGSGVALAAGLVFGAIGTDTGGSIRGPAAYCGISGIKPTYGRVSRYGIVTLAWSLDHAGAMARSQEGGGVEARARSTRRRLAWPRGDRVTLALRWAVSLIANAGSSYTLALVTLGFATAAGVLNPLRSAGRIEVVLIVSLSYTTWIAGLAFNVRANWRLLETNDISVSATSKLLHDAAKRATSNRLAQYCATAFGFVIWEAIEEVPWLLATAGIQAAASANHGWSFLAGSNLGAAVYNLTQSSLLSRISRLRRAAEEAPAAE